MKPYLLLFVCLLAGCGESRTAETIEDKPLYGGGVTPSATATASEVAASDALAAEGWQLFYDGDDVGAMWLFNRAWAMHPQNAEALWGVSAVEMNRARKEAAGYRGRSGETPVGRATAGSADRVLAGIQQAVDLMRQAQALAPHNGRLLGDLGFSLSVQGKYMDDAGADGSASLLEAEQWFTRALAIEPDYPPTLANYAIFKYNTGDTPAALEYAAKAEALGYVFPESFKQKLRQLHPM